MATATKIPMKVKTPKPKQESDEERQLRKDRITTVVVLVIVAALFGLIIWLAAQSPPSDTPYYFQHPMF